MRRNPPFTRAGFRAGLLGAAALVPGVMMFGVAFGVMAGAAGLSTAETVLFSAWVYAGTAQMGALQAWSDPVPLIAVLLMVLAMNTRYLLLGAALRPWFQGLPPHQSYGSLLVLGDGNWVAALREFEEGRDDAAFLLGSGLVMWAAWVASTAAGHLGAQLLARPERFGIDFMVIAFFATMAVPFARKAAAAWPLATGVATAVVIEQFVGGPWHILAGTVAGSLVGAVRHVDPA